MTLGTTIALIELDIPVVVGISADMRSAKIPRAMKRARTANGGGFLRR